MESARPQTTEPMARGTIITGFRPAVLELFGEDGLRAVARELPEATRRATIDELVAPMSWVPTRYVVDWHAAVWRGPAAESDDAFFRFAQRGVDQGFGRIQRIFLKLASPAQLAARGPEMWRRQHTHGTLAVAMRADTASATVTLRDHPFVDAPVSRKALAEVWRHLLTLIRLKSPRQSHGLEADGALVVRLAWAKPDA